MTPPPSMDGQSSPKVRERPGHCEGAGRGSQNGALSHDLFFAACAQHSLCSGWLAKCTTARKSTARGRRGGRPESHGIRAYLAADHRALEGAAGHGKPWPLQAFGPCRHSSAPAGALALAGSWRSPTGDSDVGMSGRDEGGEPANTAAAAVAKTVRLFMRSLRVAGAPASGSRLRRASSPQPPYALSRRRSGRRTSHARDLHAPGGAYAGTAKRIRVAAPYSITLPPRGRAAHDVASFRVQPRPLQEFLPLQDDKAVLQALVPLHELTPLHFTPAACADAAKRRQRTSPPPGDQGLSRH